MQDQSETRSSTSHAPHTRRRMTWWRRVLFAIVAPIAAGLLRTIWASYRYQVHGDEKLRELAKSGTPLVLAFWHEGIMVLGWYSARLFKIGAKVAYLISPSVDGELGVQILALFGGTAVRGSATRSGVTALRGLYRAICRDKKSPCITLDGPKGPRRYCKPGAVMIARMAGVPVVPIACAARRSLRPHTWDRHLLPLPFTRVVITVGEPYTIAADGGDDDLEVQRCELENRVNSLLEEAEAHVRRKKTTRNEYESKMEDR